MPPRRNVRRGYREPTPQVSVEESVTQPVPPPPPPPPAVDHKIVKLFLEQKPHVFDGLGEPAKAEAWIRALECIFQVLMSNDRERMICVTYQLTGSADFWWDTKIKIMAREQVDGITWEDFKQEVYNKYIPKSYREAKATEFYNLTQGRMTVTEYDRAFCDMAQYAPEQVDTDEKLSDKFRKGLRHEVKTSLASRERFSYAEALALALDIEAALPMERTRENPTSTLPSSHHSRDKRKWEGNRTPYDNKRYQTTPNQTQYGGEQGLSSQRGGVRFKTRCNVCYKHHLGECGTQNAIRCFNCGGSGHFSRECPSRKVGTGPRPNAEGFRQPPREPQIEPRENRDQPPRLQQPYRPRLPPPSRAYALE